MLHATVIDFDGAVLIGASVELGSDVGPRADDRSAGKQGWLVRSARAFICTGAR